MSQQGPSLETLRRAHSIEGAHERLSYNGEQRHCRQLFSLKQEYRRKGWFLSRCDGSLCESRDANICLEA